MYLTPRRWFFLVLLSLALMQPFNGIAQHRAGHDPPVLLEERLMHIRVSFAYFSQHPADGLVDKVVPIVQQYAHNPQRLGKVVVPDKAERRQYHYSSFPYVLRSGKPI